MAFSSASEFPNGMAKGTIKLHGHSHGRLKPFTQQFDVGVDLRGGRWFEPAQRNHLPWSRLLIAALRGRCGQSSSRR